MAISSNRERRAEQFAAFVEVTTDLINTIGGEKGATIRDAQAVQENLFVSTGNNAGQVTRAKVEAAFDALS